MASGVSKTTGVPNCKLPQAVAAKVAAHTGKPAANNKIDQIIDVVTAALEKPLKFLPQENLNTAFNMQGSEIESSDLCIALLNLDVEAVKQDLADDNLSGALTKIMYRINSYLPANIRVKTYRSFSSICTCSKTDVKIRDFIFLVINYCNTIEDKIAHNYYEAGKINQLEILKRRFRKNWSEQTGKSIEVKTTDKSDNKLEIVITEA